ncbi:uncharacterized protein TNCV_1702021 [Trichonephila clavipes]|nr:uncharacterized protein TNCV_1702021 [Trichonephila clavipes]
MRTKELFMDYFVIRDESKFHFIGYVDTHNAHIWSLENTDEVLDLQRDSSKLNIFCVISQRKVHGLSIFSEPPVTGSAYLDAQQLWLFPQLEESESNNFIW